MNYRKTRNNAAFALMNFVIMLGFAVYHVCITFTKNVSIDGCDQMHHVQCVNTTLAGDVITGCLLLKVIPMHILHRINHRRGSIYWIQKHDNNVGTEK